MKDIDSLDELPLYEKKGLAAEARKKKNPRPLCPCCASRGGLRSNLRRDESHSANGHQKSLRDHRDGVTRPKSLKGKKILKPWEKKISSTLDSLENLV